MTGVTQRSISSIAVGSSAGSACEALTLVGVLEQRKHPARDEVARRLAPGVHQQHEEQVDVHAA